jgi:hypothetical protein
MSGRTGFLAMRFVAAICGILLLCCGCERRGQAVLQPFVGALGEAWPRANSDLMLTIQARATRGKTFLHCVLKNTSLAQVPVVFDESTLPWKMPGTLGITAITANGKVFSQPSPPPVIARIGPPKKQVELKAGDSLEGDVDLASSAIGQLPRDEDGKRPVKAPSLPLICVLARSGSRSLPSSVIAFLAQRRAQGAVHRPSSGVSRRLG